MRANISFVAVVMAALLVQTANAVASDAVSAFVDKNNHILGLGAVTEKGGKVALMMIENSKGDKDALLVHFPDRAAWGRFVSSWNKARATPAPNRGWVDIDEVKDPYGVDLSVVKYASGAVGFELDDDRGDNIKQRGFKLDPSLFAAFNSKILEISKTIER
ncbi:MAG TPA: hypothetical protein VFC38_03945 [Stellaceae bacterium]|nr:hypothetical protein [Stellaceae bacterium]